jgi:oxalate---CoA ligase
MTIFDLLGVRKKQSGSREVLFAPHKGAINYSQLWQSVHQAFIFLRSAEIHRGDRVALVVPNGPEAATAFLAIASAAICAPLNPDYQSAEFEYYLLDLQAKALVVLAEIPSAAREVADRLGIQIFELHGQVKTAGLFELKHAQADFIPSSIVDLDPPKPEDIALILHTSGTTSRPKIVPLSHQNLISSAQNVATTLQLQPQDRCLNVMPLFHIHGLVASLLASLMAGSSVVCLGGFGGETFFQAIEAFQPTWYSAVPTIHQAVLAAAQDNSVHHSLRFIRSSSAALMPSVMQALENYFQVPVIEAYGMTEASHQMTSNPLPPAPRKANSVGIAGQTQVAIADIMGDRLLPQGSLGEVVIQGSSVIQGYENNPGANASSFFLGWFRTGDQGFIDEAGYLFLSGRLKELVNRGGEKVVPLEIDQALMGLEGVEQAVAFALPHPTMGEDLAAAVVLKAGFTLTAQTLRDYLFSQLAAFKVPSQIIIVPAIPKGPTGKLQRIGLGQQFAKQLTADKVAPRNETELAIAAVIAQVLNCESISVEENFFAIGGDSLKGTQVVSRLEALFNLSLSNIMLFQYPTVAQLAPQIATLLEQAQPGSLGDLALLQALGDLSPEEISTMISETLS